MKKLLKTAIIKNVAYWAIMALPIIAVNNWIFDVSWWVLSLIVLLAVERHLTQTVTTTPPTAPRTTRVRAEKRG